MRFWNYKSKEFYNLYSQIFDTNFSIEKKKVILKALFSGEYNLMRITSISKHCYEEYKKNNFKKLSFSDCAVTYPRRNNQIISIGRNTFVIMYPNRANSELYCFFVEVFLKLNECLLNFLWCA